MLRHILSARPHENLQLLLQFDGGERRIVDFRPLIEKGGMCAKLGDPDFFRRVAVGDDDRYLVWPGEIDLCADALWCQGTPVVERQNLESTCRQS